MSIKATASIKKEPTTDRSGNKSFHASLSLRAEAGKEYGLPRFFSGFEEVGRLLQREAGVAHEELQDRYPDYEKGEEVRIYVTLESDEEVRNLGFDPKAA